VFVFGAGLLTPPKRPTTADRRSPERVHDFPDAQ